jgi:hypothetical protein
MSPNQITLKTYHYRPQGRRAIGRPKKRWREQLYLWRRNASKGPILDVYDDDDDEAGTVTFGGYKKERDRRLGLTSFHHVRLEAVHHDYLQNVLLELLQNVDLQTGILLWFMHDGTAPYFLSCISGILEQPVAETTGRTR